MNRRDLLVAATAALAFVACSGGASRTPALVYDPRALPSGPVGVSIAYGRAIVMQTPKLMKPFVRADLSCDACHLAGGTVARGGSLMGTYARFPQWNRRARRVISLQDRIAECFLYSMNGTPPPYASDAMIAIVAYIAWLSRGTTIGASRSPGVRDAVALPDGAPSVAGGAALYASKCSMCHRSNGSGETGIFPPVWGPRSFNRGAGMAHIEVMTAFIRYNMPRNAPGSLSVSQAYDVAAFILSHPRPSFHKNALVLTPSLPAKYF